VHTLLPFLPAATPQQQHQRWAGNDGEPSPTILARLPALLAAHPAPAAVTIFSGSNDCIAQESASLQRVYSWRFGLQQPCSEQGALDNALAMVEMVRQQAPQAKVRVLVAQWRARGQGGLGGRTGAPGRTLSLTFRQTHAQNNRHPPRHPPPASGLCHFAADTG
jgi:lysophospholipase L1-like esterase